MLRNRSRTVTTKQSLMPDHNTVPTPKPNQTTSMSSFLGSPRFFNRFFSKGVTKSETVIRSTSRVGIPFGYYDQNITKSQRAVTRNKQFSDNKRIGLALINSLINENSPDHKSLVQFGSKLKIHIPTLPLPATSPIHSSTNFGVNSQNLHFSSPSSGLNSWVDAKESPDITTACLSWSEMELSEDYTCVISHGPNPKTTRIFDNCIVESCCGVVALSDLKKEYNLSSSPSQTSFLSSCHTCKKNLGEGKDIYMYRGEKAFCSNECRCEEMFLDEMDN